MPSIAEAFDADLAWARATLPGMSEYPVPDALPRVDGKPVLESWWTADVPAYDIWKEPRTEGKRRLVAGSDFATRFVAITWVFGLWAASPGQTEEEPEDEASASFECLTDLVGLRTPEETVDPREAAWELVCRCAIRDWEGARAFLGRFINLASLSPRNARTLRGQLAAIVALVLDGDNVPLGYWRPRLDLDSSLRDGPIPTDDDGQAWLRPMALLFWGVTSDPLPPNDQLRLTITDAAHELAQANSLEKLPAPYRAFMARAFVNSGRRQEGAALYRAIVDEAPWASLSNAPRLRRNIAEALAAAGDSQRAAALMEELLREHQDTRLCLRLARLYIESESDHRKAYDLLERAVAADPSLGSEPAIGIGLAFGRLGVDALTPQAVRHALGASESTLAVARGLLQSLVRGFDRLSPASQEELVDAAIALNAPEDGSLHAKGRFQWCIVLSARSVERELQEQILKPFRVENRQTPPESERDPIAAFLRGRRAPGVGEMLQALVRPKAAAERQLQSWARSRHHSEFVKWLALHDTSALSRARTPVVHATGSPAPGRDEALAVFDLAIGILATLPE